MMRRWRQSVTAVTRMVSSWRAPAAAVFALLVVGCATPQHSDVADADAFRRTGRFAATVHDGTDQPEAVQGGFAWQDNRSQLILDLTNPVGSTLARITVTDDGAVLQHSNGTREVANSPDALAERVLGSPIPVAGLRDWLRGETGDAPVTKMNKDDQGRPVDFVQDDWRVALSRYDDKVPGLLQLTRTEAQRRIRVRLVVSKSAS